MIDFNAFSTEIFQILRSYEKEIVLYDENGTRVFEPEDARRMYVIGDNLLVSIVEDGDNSALKFYLSPSFNLSQVEGLLNTLRTISVQSNLLFHVKKYNKEIKPKDFAMQATIEEQQENPMNIMEGLYGTSKSSYLKLEHARMIVRHSARVNERVIGDRGRHIQSIFVENQEGERLRFPVNMLSGARAMTQHVNNGGTFADEVGSQIIRMARDFSDLAQVAGHINVMPGIAEAIKAKTKEPKIEAYGVKGMTSKQWRKVFKNADAMNKWCDDNDAEVHGQSEVNESFDDAILNAVSLRSSILESMTAMKRSFDRIYTADTYMKESARLVTGQVLSEDDDALAAKVARVTEMLGEGVLTDAVATVARLVNLESVSQPLSEDDTMAIEESITPMYKCEIPEDALELRATSTADLTNLIFNDFVEHNDVMPIEAVDVKGYVVFFMPAIGDDQPIDPVLQDKLTAEFNHWCETQEEMLSSSSLVHEDEMDDDMEEATMRIRVPGHPLGECANHPTIKAFDEWMESFNPDAIFGGNTMAEDEDMGDDGSDDEGESMEETFQGQPEEGDQVTISARGDFFGKKATIIQVPAKPDGHYIVMVDGKQRQIARKNFDAPQLMSVNTMEPEMAMEDMAPPIETNDKWVVFGTMGLNGKFKKKFDDELARDEWIAAHENDERFVITGTKDPVVDEGALRVGSKAYNEVSRLASSNIDRTAEEKKRAKDIKWKADQAAAEAAARKKGEEVDEDLRPSMFTKTYDGPKVDHSAQASEIEHMVSTLSKGNRDEFNSVLNSCLNIVDPGNDKSIADCLDLLSPERVDALVRELKSIYDKGNMNEAFDPEPVAGDTVTVTASGKYKGKTATVVSVPSNPSEQWVLNVDGENKKTMRSSFEFKPTVKESIVNESQEKFYDESQWAKVAKANGFEIESYGNFGSIAAYDKISNEKVGQWRSRHDCNIDEYPVGWFTVPVTNPFASGVDESINEDSSSGDVSIQIPADSDFAHLSSDDQYAAIGSSSNPESFVNTQSIAPVDDVSIDGSTIIFHLNSTADKASIEKKLKAAFAAWCYNFYVDDIHTLMANNKQARNHEDGVAHYDAIDRARRSGLGEGKSFKRNDEDDADDKKAKDQQRKDAAKNKRQVKESDLTEPVVGPEDQKIVKAVATMLKNSPNVTLAKISQTVAKYLIQIGKTFKDDGQLTVLIAKELGDKVTEDVAMGMSDEVAAKKIAAKIQGTPDLTMPKIQAMVTRYLGAVGKNETDVPHLVALVHTELGDMVTEGTNDPQYWVCDENGTVVEGGFNTYDEADDASQELRDEDGEVYHVSYGIVTDDRKVKVMKDPLDEGKTFKRGKDDDADDKIQNDKARKDGAKQKRQVAESKESLEDKVARLQKEYTDCDDFPTARHEIKAELDKAKAELKASKKVKESVTLKAGQMFKLLGESELLFAKQINETQVLVSTAEGQEKWFESKDLNIDPKTIKTLK